MRQTDKKQLREILAKLASLKEEMETFKDQHQEWMDERDYDTNGAWSETETGERASDEQYSFEEWYDTLESMENEIEEMI